MSLLEIVKSAADNIVSAGASGEYVYLNTFCIYPSNSFVQLYIYGHENNNSFVVSDNGGAINEVVSAGIDDFKSNAVISRRVNTYGLFFKDGVIRSPLCSRDSLSVGIALVANASKDIADWIFNSAKIKHTKDFKALLKAYLNSTFEDRVHKDVVIAGASNKLHKFEHVIYFPNFKRLIIDPVIYDHSSISARIVANMDVRLKDIQGLEQRIIYDDDDNWKPEDLNLLQVGTKVIPFSRTFDVIPRLAEGQFA